MRNGVIVGSMEGEKDRADLKRRARKGGQDEGMRGSLLTGRPLWILPLMARASPPVSVTLAILNKMCLLKLRRAKVGEMFLILSMKWSKREKDSYKAILLFFTLGNI
jgi:hypothetical protein